MKTGLSLGLFVSLLGCADERPAPAPGSGRLDLRAAMQTGADVSPVGIAIDPDGHRFVFEATGGLYRLDGDRAVAVVPMSAMPDPGPAAPLKLPITDLVAVAPNVFALTAIGDGYILDVAAMTLQQRFCYLPVGTPPELTQRTDAVAYDAASARLYAQPVTYDAAGVTQYAEVAGYDLASGTDLEWHTTRSDVAATGMVSIAGFGLVLGQGSRLSRFDPATSLPVPLDDLERFGVRSIDGLAIDPATGALVVVDKQADAVFDIELSLLGR